MRNRREYHQKYYLENKEKITIRNKNWKEKNKEKRKEYMDEYNSIYRKTDKAKNASKNWRDKNPEKVRAQKHRSYVKNRQSYLIRNGEYAKKNKEIHNAQNAVKRAVKTGLLIKPKNCQICNGTYRIEGHHSDYSKPLEVIWVCSKCHHKIHYETSCIQG